MAARLRPKPAIGLGKAPAPEAHIGPGAYVHAVEISAATRKLASTSAVKLLS